jgi:hypothetical protein
MRIGNELRKRKWIKSFSNHYFLYENDFSLLKFKNLSWVDGLEKYYVFIFFESILHKMDEFKKTSCGNVIGSMAFTINLGKKD